MKEGMGEETEEGTEEETEEGMEEVIEDLTMHTTRWTK